MRVGFTGTREGMTDAQFVRFRAWFRASTATEFHHGCCVGADEDAAAKVYDSYRLVRVIGHPSNLKTLTSSDAVACCDDLRAPAPPLDRNRDIVDACDVLVACPKGMAEERRSGTWATVRYARKRGKRIVIVWPNGTVTEQPAP